MSMFADSTAMETQTIPEKKERHHVVIFPFPSRGHIIPLLHLSATLAARGVKITIITTAGNSSFFNEYLQVPRPNIHVKIVSFPRTPSIPSGVECTNDLPSFDLFPSFLQTTFLLDQPFREALNEMLLSDDVPLCVISDFFSGWTLDICQEFGIPRVVFHGMGVFSMALCKALFAHGLMHGFEFNESDFHVEGTPENLRLSYHDVPDDIRNTTNDGIGEFLPDMARSEVNSWGVIVNSFAEMEMKYIPYLESFYNGGKAWLAGPLCLYPTKSALHIPDDREKSCLEWLDGREKGSVLYVAFGTMVYWPEEQLDEMWHGLESSGHQYLWVVRSETWTPPEKQSNGLIHESWAPQKEILNHPFVGGFLSHCGWNSVLEGVTAAIPILAWPVIAEQRLNAKFLVDELEVALRLNWEREKLVGREVIREGARELMDGAGGRKARENVRKLGLTARAVVAPDGSSYEMLDKLIEKIRRYKC